MNYVNQARTLLLMLAFSLQLFAVETGTLSVFTFLNGCALENSEVIVDGKSYRTDVDGLVKIRLETGSHQVEIFGKDTGGINLGYYKKPITIVKGKDTEIIAEFNDAERPGQILIDTPVEGQDSDNQLDMSKVGTLIGTVMSTEQNLTIQNARVFVRGTSVDARTDENGRFIVEIPADVNISISVVHSEYSAQTINDIFVKEGATVEQEIMLTPASMELEEFVVLAPKIEGSIASIMQEEKQSSAITNILGSEEMSKKGDSDAASALKRVTGVTLIGGKSIYVRGLGDRYSNVEMNSMPLPSPDPTKRVVPLDIFPAGVIGSMKVQKSATADVPANFGGGYIDIRTKESSKEEYVRLSVELKANSNTGKEVYQGKSYSDDWTGYDSHRAIDPSILDATEVVVGERVKGFTLDYFTPEEISEYTQLFADRDYSVTKKKLPYGGKMSLGGSVNFEVADDHKITVFGNFEYGNESKIRNEEYFNYDFDLATKDLKPNPTQEGTIEQAATEYTLSGIINIGYMIGDVFKIKYTKLYTHNTLNNTRHVDGILGSNDYLQQKFYLDWEERTLDVDQFSGDFDYAVYGYDNSFRFGYEIAKAELYQPNNYEYTYTFDEQNNRYFFDTKDAYPNATNLESEDEMDAYYLGNKFKFDLLSEDDFLDLGYSASSKYRESRQRQYGMKRNNRGPYIDYDGTFIEDIESVYNQYVRPDIDFNDRTLVINSIYNPSYYYDAEVDQSDLFAQIFIKPTDKIELLVGARQVNINQTVYQYKSDRSDGLKIKRFPEELTVDELYPSLGLKYKLNESNHFDFAYSKTFIIPDLREFTDGSYRHPYEVATVIGNPDLVNTDIENYDFKYSHYFSDTENIKFGLFYKYLDKPIEDVQLPSSSLPIYSFDNTDFATMYGFELDGRKSFDYIDKSLKDFYLSGNFSYTNSEVTLMEDQVDIYSTNHRQLQGLSPTVINLSLGYEIPDRSVVVSYNKMGERIRKIGVIEIIDDEEYPYPDDIEIPPSIVDFVWIEKFDSGLGLKLKLGNLLDDETVWKQNDRITKRFKDGRTYSFAVSYKY